MLVAEEHQEAAYLPRICTHGQLPARPVVISDHTAGNHMGPTLVLEGEGAAMTVGKVLLALLGIWILMGVVGFIIKGLFWLFILACVAFGFTVAVSARRRGILPRR